MVHFRVAQQGLLSGIDTERFRPAQNLGAAFGHYVDEGFHAYYKENGIEPESIAGVLADVPEGEKRSFELQMPLRIDEAAPKRRVSDLPTVVLGELHHNVTTQTGDSKREPTLKTVRTTISHDPSTGESTWFSISPEGVYSDPQVLNPEALKSNMSRWLSTMNRAIFSGQTRPLYRFDDRLIPVPIDPGRPARFAVPKSDLNR